MCSTTFKARAEALEDGQWIVLQQVFITRLREQRYPTRAELDQVAPKNPVVFRTGPDASVNTLALKLSGIDKDFRVTDGGPGYVEKDPKTGEPTGILRSCTRYLKIVESGRKATDRDRYERVLALFKDYSSVGITGICDGDVEQEELDLYQQMLKKGELPVRISAQCHVDTIGPLEQIQENIRKVAQNPLRQGGPMLRIIGVKTYLDGGMLTGSAYMSKPWGVSKTYAIDDPNYRGVLFIPKERLIPMVRTATECGLQFTAHTVGDGAVATLLDAYDEVNKTTPIRDVRHCITHSNFMSRESVEKMARLHVFPLVQPAWLYLDTRTLVGHFGYDRLRYFQPLKSLFEAGVLPAGGSDHMQKIGSLRSNNLYDPVPGHGDGRHAPGPVVRGTTSSGRGPEPRAGDPVLHDQLRPGPVPGQVRRLAGERQTRRLHRAGHGPAHLPAGRDPQRQSAAHLHGRQARLPAVRGRSFCVYRSDLLKYLVDRRKA